MVVFVPRGQDLAIDGCQGERRIVQVELFLFADVAHCGRLGRGCMGGYAVVCQSPRCSQWRVECLQSGDDENG